VAADPFIPEGALEVRRGRTPPPALRDVDTADLPTIQQAPFRRLKMRHRRVIVAHLQGASNADIATALRCSPGYVSQVLRNPTVIPILQRCYKDYEAEFQSLTPLCINALRENLQGDDGTLQLKAVDITFKRQGAYDKERDSGQTAEDVIEKILKITGRDGTRLEFSERRFLQAGDQHTDGESSSDPKIIDV